MFGGDWPVATLAGDYAKVWRETTATLARLEAADRDRVRGGTAVEFYRLAL
jgi:L-fuconolactonase